MLVKQQSGGKSSDNDKPRVNRKSPDSKKEEQKQSQEKPREVIINDKMTFRSASPEGNAFNNIKDRFSTYDIRKVYRFEKLIGGGNFGTVRLAHRLSDPNIKYAVKSILKQNIKKDVKLLEEELEIL